MEPVIASGPVMTTDRENEKMHWYREVLALEPASRVFLPFARLLADTGQTEQAISALRDGLVFHPEFVEARLFLIELLHKSGHTSVCRTETAHLTEVFRKYPGFWDAWASQEEEAGSPAELPLVLQLLGTLLHGGGVSLTDILAAGLRTLTHKPQPEQASEPETAGVQPFAAEVAAIEEAEPVAEAVAVPVEVSVVSDTGLKPEDMGQEAFLEAHAPEVEPEESEAPEIVLQEGTEESLGSADIFGDDSAPDRAEVVSAEVVQEPLTASQPELQPEFPEDETQTLAVDELDDILDSIGATGEVLPDSTGADVPETGIGTPTDNDVQPDADSEPMFEFADESEPVSPTAEPELADLDLPDLDLSDLVAASAVPEPEREPIEETSPVSEPVVAEDETPLEVELDGLDSLDSLLEGQDLPDSIVPDAAATMPEAEFFTEEAVGEAEGCGTDHNEDDAAEKCSLRTRSMAEVLAEQGDLPGAVGIYEELLAHCEEKDRPGLENRLEELKARLGTEATPDAPDTPPSAPKQSAGNAGDMVSLLEKLAVRLENKAAAKRPA